MTCSAARRLHGRKTLKLILSEESREKRGDAPGLPAKDRHVGSTAANIFAPQEYERWSHRKAISAYVGLSLALWALLMVPVVMVLS
jgi:hypothetical protein